MMFGGGRPVRGARQAAGRGLFVWSGNHAHAATHAGDAPCGDMVPQQLSNTRATLLSPWIPPHQGLEDTVTVRP